MELATFNCLPAGEATELVSVWAAVPWWAEALVAGRPYADVPALRAEADGLARRWSAADVERALAAHPRIGEPPPGAGAHATSSRREQSSVGDADATTLVQLRRGNQEYERRFGRVFLIRAAGRSATEILGELSRRLDLDAEAEAAEAGDQLREIALLRLEAELGEEVRS